MPQSTECWRESTTWKMSPFAMCSLAASTASRKSSPVRERERGRRLGTPRGRGPALPAEVLLERVEPLLRAIEGRAAAGLGERDQHQALAHVVEGHERVVEGEGRDGALRGPVLVRQPLEEARRVPGEVADGAAREARQAGDLGRLRAETAAQRGEQTVLGLVLAVCVVDADLAAHDLEPRDGVAPEEGVAGEPLAAEDALQQERALGARGQREERRDRRPQVARAARGRPAPAGRLPTAARTPRSRGFSSRVISHSAVLRSSSITRASGRPRWWSATSR